MESSKTKNILIIIRKKFLRFKQCIARTTTYLSIVNSGMILLLFLSKLQEMNYINMDLDKYFLIIMVFGIFALFFIGWIDIKFIKGFQEENNLLFELSPNFVEMRHKINYLYEKEKSK